MIHGAHSAQEARPATGVMISVDSAIESRCLRCAVGNFDLFRELELVTERPRNIRCQAPAERTMRFRHVTDRIQG